MKTTRIAVAIVLLLGAAWTVTAQNYGARNKTGQNSGTISFVDAAAMKFRIAPPNGGEELTFKWSSKTVKTKEPAVGQKVSVVWKEEPTIKVATSIKLLQ